MPDGKMCTEHQKKLMNFFRATFTKILHIKINLVWTLISYSTPYEVHLRNQRVVFVKKDKNVVKLQRVIF